MTAWAASAAGGNAGGTSQEVLVARCLDRQLGSPLASLLQAVRAADRLLSAATVLPEMVGEDPFATLRSLLKSPAKRSPEQLHRSAPRGSNSLPEKRVPVRNATAHSRRSDLPSGSEHVSASRRAAQAASARDAATSAAPVVRSTSPRPPPGVATAMPLNRPDVSTAIAAGRPQPTVANVSDALAQRRRRLRGSLDAICDAATGAHPAVPAESIVNRRSAAADAPLSLGEQAVHAGCDVTLPTHALHGSRNGAAVAARGHEDTLLTSPDPEAPQANALSASVPGATAVPDREMPALPATTPRTAGLSAHTTSAAVTPPSKAAVSSNRTMTRELLRARTQAAVLPDTPVDTVLETAYRNGVDLS